MRNRTGILITCLAFMTLAAWGFATNRVVLVERPAHYELAGDCNEAADPIGCVAERIMAGGM